MLDKDMTVEEACDISSKIETQTQKEFEDIIEMNVIIEPYKKNNDNLHGTQATLG